MAAMVRHEVRRMGFMMVAATSAIVFYWCRMGVRRRACTAMKNWKRINLIGGGRGSGKVILVHLLLQIYFILQHIYKNLP